jgi:hypothetical protein
MPQTAEKPFSLVEDEELTCVDCKTPFLFTVGEQEFFTSKGFTNRPKRCKACHTAHKAKKDSVQPRNGRH